MSPLQVRGSSFAIIGEPPSSVNSLNPGLGGLSIFERECSAFGLLKNDTRGDGVYSRQLHHGFRVLPDIARNINVLLYERGYLLDRRERKSLGQTKIEPYIYRHLSYWGPLGSKPETDDVKREGVALAEKAFALRQKLVNNDLVDEGVVVVDRFTSATDTERLQSLLKNEDEFRKSKESRSESHGSPNSPHSPHSPLYLLHLAATCHLAESSSSPFSCNRPPVGVLECGVSVSVGVDWGVLVSG
eukprot:GHVN01084296.1.p1 GENE.GHVN01084296.1~~GHVN01084296.1.p1  ORF type:complete len:244 (-),score=38.21 GHVN01084296.1:187-918(-)